MQSSTANPEPDAKDAVPPTTDTPTAVRPKGLAEVVLRLFAIVVPALYAMGRFYASSWWQGIGLPSSLERYAFEDYLFLGFYAVLGSVGEYYIGEVGWRLLQAPLVVALCVLFYLTINGAMDWLAREIRLAATRLLAMRRFQWLAPVVRTPFVRVPAISAAITLPILSALTTLLFFIILPLVLAEKAGARDARRLEERLAKGVDVSAFPKVHASQGLRLPGDARLVQCTPEWCVVFSNGAFHALPKASIAQAGPRPILSTSPPVAPALKQPTAR
jgi:hypothetical protein